MNEYVQSIVGFVIIIIGLAGAYLITKFASYWTLRRDEIESNIRDAAKFNNNSIAQELLKRVFNVVDDVVAAINTKFKKELLAATKDGKLTEEDKRKLRDKALELVKVELPDSIWDELSDVVGDVDETLKTLIENSVAKQKTPFTTLEVTEEIVADPASNE